MVFFVVFKCDFLIVLILNDTDISEFIQLKIKREIQSFPRSIDTRRVSKQIFVQLQWLQEEIAI